MGLGINGKLKGANISYVYISKNENNKWDLGTKRQSFLTLF